MASCPAFRFQFPGELTSRLQCNRMNVPAVIRLFAVHRAAVAKKTLVGIGIDADIVDHQDAGVFEPHPDQSRKVEHRMVLALGGNEKHGAFRIGLEKAFDEFAADFVGVLANQGPDRRDDAAAVGAELFHGLDGGFHDAGQRAFPPRMNRADHARVRIDQQYRSAVGGGDADGETFGARDDGVGARPRRALPRPGRHHGIGRMDLEGAEQALRRNSHLFRHPAAIFRDIGGIVARAEAAVEALVDAVGHAALAREERMTEAGNGGEQRGSQSHEGSALGCCWSSSNPASAVSLGSEIASTLNIEPMPPRPPPISRFSAPEMSSEISGVVLAISVTARVSMPSRWRKSPCDTGPGTRAPRSSAARASAWKSR